MNIQEYGNKDANVILIQLVNSQEQELMGQVVEQIQTQVKNQVNQQVKQDFLLRTFQVNSWNKDLAPWKAPAVFGKEDFGDGAAETLKEVLEACNDPTKKYYIGGYSLAGLFALWSVYQTNLFQGCAAVSPSIWFPDFVEYMKDHEIKQSHSEAPLSENQQQSSNSTSDAIQLINQKQGLQVYLSLGDREHKARNPLMASVAEKIQEAYHLLEDEGFLCTLEWNEGNHFKDVDVRIAKAWSWLLNQ